MRKIRVLLAASALKNLILIGKISVDVASVDAKVLLASVDGVFLGAEVASVVVGSVEEVLLFSLTVDVGSIDVEVLLVGVDDASVVLKSCALALLAAEVLFASVEVGLVEVGVVVASVMMVLLKWSLRTLMSLSECVDVSVGVVIAVEFGTVDFERVLGIVEVSSFEMLLALVVFNNGSVVAVVVVFATDV
ncbi:unnamed protein product [Strongylus vulgaris]|uniref:Uncharacterized protein n=1 Tax=Strongylus vulgaris TaxID=40348 RepID=A0A3P7JEM1_STRVU|nr:unnamed protein product [Strongylus vulgaris]